MKNNDGAITDYPRAAQEVKAVIGAGVSNLILQSVPLQSDPEPLRNTSHIADAGVQFLTGEKSLNGAGLQAMNAGCRAVDRTLDRTLVVAERAVGTVCDAISYFKFR